MKGKEMASLVKTLRERRAALFREVAGTEAGLQFIAEDTESELEERAQEERLAQLFVRLDIRGKQEIEQIDAALARFADGTYGTCTACTGKIADARLRVLPHTPLCVDCARASEGVRPAAEEGEAEGPRRGPVPADFNTLTDREMEATLREQVRDDGRIDMDELRIVCRHGVVYLDGAVPSEAERQMLLKRVTDVAGFEEVVDRLQLKEILWEREDRAKEPIEETQSTRVAPDHTEDVVKSIEEGVDYVPPVEPPADEE